MSIEVARRVQELETEVAALKKQLAELRELIEKPVPRAEPNTLTLKRR